MLAEYFRNLDVRCEKNKDTKKLSSIKAGGTAKLVVYPQNAHSFISAIRICRRLELRHVVIGNCSNTAFSDSGFDGVVISTALMKDVLLADGRVTLGCGVLLPSVIRALAKDGLCLPAQLSGIPGSIGGALKNNAGAFGVNISDIFLEGVFYCAEDDTVQKLSINDIDFGYRSSSIAEKKLYLVEATVQYKCSDFQCQSEEIAKYTEKRRISQPKEPSLGSFFKRPNGCSAGQLIDSLGLKGFSVGGAAVSEKHAGFIVNKGGATVRDIESVAEECRRRVFDKFSILLVREAEIINNELI